MNKFQEKFFEKYIPEWHEIQAIIHEHWINILDKLVLNIGLLVLIPSFLFYHSIALQENIPFWWFELYLIFIYIKIIYDLFDWYNDVWIITDKAVIKLKWALFKTKMESINYENIEWIEVEQNWILDSLFNKWDIVIHKFWEEELRLKDAAKPYIAIDIVEENIEKFKHPEEEIDKFDLVMDTLAWVVKQYMQKKEPWQGPCRSNYIKDEDIEEEIIEEKIKQIKQKDGVIDLR